MLNQIDKRGKLLVKIRCDTCGWVKWMKPKLVPKYHNCPNCIVKLNEKLLTPEEVEEVKETLKEPKKLEVAIEEIEVKPVDPHADTEKIVNKKSSKKHK